MNLKKVLLIIIHCCLAMPAFGQLSDLHYLPPLKQGGNNQAIEQQAIYFSTPETDPFNVSIYRGTSNTPLHTFTLSNGAPYIYTLATGDNNITLVDNNNTGVVLTNSGLRIESSGEKFYTNYRGSSKHQATSLTSKGRQAMGTKFKWGGIPNRGSQNSLTTTLGIMATKNNTTIKIYGYHPDSQFRLQNNVAGITSDTYTITLNKNESFVLEAYKGTTTFNVDGWLGATIESDKDIVISNGGLNVGVNPGSGSRDAGIDQPVPQNRIGKEYVFIRGNGTSLTEKPIIIGTQNNTEIFVNGSATPIATINDGDYFEVPESHYNQHSSGGNMFVRTSKDAYAYQLLAGASGIQTIGLNFVAPVNCLLPDNLNNIPSVRDAAGTTMNGGVSIIASTSTPDDNIVVTDGTGPVTLPAANPVPGAPDWKTFYVPNLNGNVSVQSTGPIAVGFVGYSGNKGIGGYYSGFDTVPSVDLQTRGGGCLPGATIEVVDANFDAYQWYESGNAIPGAIFQIHTPTKAGDYYVKVTKGGCTYDSQPIAVYYCLPDVIIKKKADTASILEGDTFTYTITVESLGVDPVTNLVVTDNLPAGLTLVSASPSVGSWSSPNWNIGTINAGELVRLDLEVSADELPYNTTITSYTNTATHTQDQLDSNRTADEPSATVSITNNELTLTKKVLPAPDGAYDTLGEIMTYQLVVTNHGPDTLTDIRITDAIADLGSISPASLASLAPGNSATFTLTHTITQADLQAFQVVNSATAYGSLPNGFVISDESDDPDNPTNFDSNGDGEPDDPTVTPLKNPRSVITNRRITYRVKP
ncbi:MAG: DUF11 domain-containing protein [Arenibacter sp.]|nr:DUF11 domain-containing protein [Arenibacter sp.]